MTIAGRKTENGMLNMGAAAVSDGVSIVTPHRNQAGQINRYQLSL